MDRLDLLQKLLKQLCGLNFCINYNSSAHFDPSVVKQRNGPKCSQLYDTKQNMSLGSNGGGSVVFICEKIRTRLRGMNFYINCSSSAHFAPSFMQYRNGPKCIKHYKNTTKDEFRVQWGGSGSFVVKTSHTTSRHELMH